MKNFFISRFQTIQDFLQTQRFPLADWQNLGSWDFWTGGPLDSFSPYYAFGLGLFLVTLIALEVWRRHLKKVHQTTPIYGEALIQISNLFYFILLLVPAYWFFRVQQLSYLSSRLLLGSIVLAAIVWLAWIAFVIAHRLPTKRQSYLEKERFFRYLPTTSAPGSVPGRKKGKKK